jgi:hypothetical protein
MSTITTTTTTTAAAAAATTTTTTPTKALQVSSQSMTRRKGRSLASVYGI